MNDNDLPAGCLYESRTMHARFTPFERRFSYRVNQILIDIDRVEELTRGAKLLRYNAPGLFSFHDKDHGDRSGAPLRAWAEVMFARAGVGLDGGAVRLLTFPRVLGRVFNPISIFFGYGPEGEPRGVIYEVNNTFGETHAYVAPLEGDAPARHCAEKLLHVSPFFDVRGEYAFQLQPPTERFSLIVENFVAGEREHVATLVGRRARLTDEALMRAFLSLPFLGFGVLASIHWQAFLLRLRGARFHPKPAPPNRPATIVREAARTNIQYTMTTR